MYKFHGQLDTVWFQSLFRLGGFHLVPAFTTRYMQLKVMNSAGLLVTVSLVWQVLNSDSGHSEEGSARWQHTRGCAGRFSYTTQQSRQYIIEIDSPNHAAAIDRDLPSVFYLSES